MSEFESYDMTKFLENCEKMNLTLSTEQQQQFVRYYELLVEWNSFMNLTGITDFCRKFCKNILRIVLLW